MLFLPAPALPGAPHWMGCLEFANSETYSFEAAAPGSVQLLRGKQAGIHGDEFGESSPSFWAPAFAGEQRECDVV